MGTSRTSHAVAPAASAHRPHDRLVASRNSGARGRAHLRLVPDRPVSGARVRRTTPGAATPRSAGRGSAAPVPARRGVPEAAAPVPIRLTRRGRVVVVLFLATALVVAGWFVSRAVAEAATTHPPTGSSVVAHPNDTLWSVAVRTRPDVDPRITVEHLIDVNGLATPVIQPGQRLILPRS